MMNWKRFFSRTATRDAKASRTGAIIVNSTGGHAPQPKFTPRRYDQLAAEAYQKNVIAYRAIKLVSQNAATIPWALFERDRRSGGEVRVQKHPLLDLLARPNPLESGAEFLERVYAFFLIAGNSYVEHVGPKTGTPRELWVLRPDRMRIIPGGQSMPAGYRFTVNNEHTDFAVDALSGASRILHLKSFHPLDDWYGMSALEAAAVSVDQHNDAAKWNAHLLQSSGRPSGALVYKPADSNSPQSLTDEQRRALRDDINTYFSGPEAAGKPLVLEGGLDWREMSLSPKDMDFLAGKDVSAREIALAFHVPPQLIGVDGSLTFANFEQARLALYDDAILPMAMHLRDELNHWLVPLFSENLRLDLDLEKVEALSPRREALWARISAAGFMTDDEKRAALGLGQKPVSVPATPTEAADISLDDIFSEIDFEDDDDAQSDNTDMAGAA